MVHRQKDIEIFVRGCSECELLAWIESTIGLLARPETAGDVRVYSSEIGAVVIAAADDGFTSVWFNTPHGPWPTDVECARKAAQYLKCVVRCDPGAAFKNAPSWSDEFLEIDGNLETLVEWA